MSNQRREKKKPVLVSEEGRGHRIWCREPTRRKNKKILAIQGQL